jgi:glutathione reductase (NADPH)
MLKASMRLAMSLIAYELTPVAIHEAMCLIDTLYRDRPTSPDHDMIATAVFSQPEIGTVGLSEDEAAAKKL